MPGPAPEPDRFNCELCAAFYPTRQGLVWRRYKVHNCRAPLKSLSEGTQCIACLFTFSTRERLYKHLMGLGSRCRDTYSQSQVPMSLDALEAVEAQARDDRRRLAHFRETHSTCPPYQVYGPYIAEAINTKISFESGLASGKMKLAEL